MYTLLGRVAARPDRRAGFLELHLALLLPHHRSGRRRGRAGDAEGGRAGGHLAVRRGLAVLAARRLCSIVFMMSGAVAQAELRRMDRNFYYIGIAFFGMINGLFNQAALLFALFICKCWRPRCCSAASSLTLMFASLMVSTATIILGGIPAAIYERYDRRQRTIRPRPRCGSGLPARRCSRSRPSAISSKSASDAGHRSATHAIVTADADPAINVRIGGHFPLSRPTG